MNEATGRHSETFAITLKAAPNAAIIGSAIFSGWINTTPIVLPGNILTLIPATGLYTPDGRDMLYSGIRLDVELKPTLKGIIEGRDELIEKAIEIINRIP